MVFEFFRCTNQSYRFREVSSTHAQNSIGLRVFSTPNLSLVVRTDSFAGADLVNNVLDPLEKAEGGEVSRSPNGRASNERRALRKHRPETRLSEGLVTWQVIGLISGTHRWDFAALICFEA
jgi:hypothetical protein